MAIPYIPGELYSLRDHKSTVPAVLLAQSGNTVIFEKHFADGSTSLRLFDWREPLERQHGRTVDYEDLSIWDLRNIIQAGIPWQGTPRPGNTIPSPTILYEYKHWLSLFRTLWKSNKKEIQTFLKRLDWPYETSWTSGGCAIAAESIRRWLVSNHYQVNLVVVRFGLLYKEAHMYVRLSGYGNTILLDDTRLIDTKGIDTQMQIDKGYSTQCHFSDVEDIDHEIFAFDEALCQKMATALVRFGSCEPLQKMMEAWSAN